MEAQLVTDLLERYPYDELTDPTQQIRLLRIKQATGEITYELETFQLSQAPRYAAISYTWGPPVCSRHIVISNLTVVVRENCFLALWQAGGHGLYDHVWIDALSINQSSLSEKGSQVAMMGEIFARADTVLVSLAPHQHDSEKLLAELKSFFGPRDSSDVPFRRRANWAGLYPALKGFTHRPYWSRIWIVQELMVAKTIVFLCGTDLIDWLPLERAREFGSFMKACGWSPGPYRSPMKTIAQTVEKQRLSLNYIVSNFSTWECTNPLDRIYGFLHVLEWTEEQSSTADRLTPDYSKTPGELMLQCMDMLIETGGRSSSRLWGMAREVMSCLRISHEDDGIVELLRKRQMPTGPSFSPAILHSLPINPDKVSKLTFGKTSRLAKYKDGCFTAALARVSGDDRTIPLLYSTAEAVPRKSPYAPGEWGAGFVHASAAAGDLILEPLGALHSVGDYRVCLLARETSLSGVWAVIGYAALHASWDFHRASGNRHFDRLDEQLQPLGGELEGVFCSEDLVAHTALKGRHRATTLPWSTRALLDDICATRLTGQPFSSFIVRKSDEF